MYDKTPSPAAVFRAGTTAFRDGRSRKYLILLSCYLALASLFLWWYFQHYRHPYMLRNVVDISDGWACDALPADDGRLWNLRDLARVVEVPPGDALTLHRQIAGAGRGTALMLRTNHQIVRLYLDGAPFFANRPRTFAGNPGMQLLFVPLPEDYPGGTLSAEIVSPYPLYAGRLSPIFLGDVPSLEALALSSSMRSVFLMSLCLFMGFCIIGLSFLRTARREWNHADTAIGFFSVFWGLYYVSTEYVAYQFFGPVAMSRQSIGLYMFMQLPLALFFYFSFRRYRRHYAPVAALHAGFVCAALLLQATGLAELAELLNVNNAFYALLFPYAILLSLLEARGGNRFFLVVAVFMTIAYLAMMRAFTMFYLTRGPVNYTLYKDAFFLLILAVLLHEVARFFRRHYEQQRRAAILELQNKSVLENYERAKQHFDRVARLKHEMKNHFAALQTLIADGESGKAAAYLAEVTHRSELAAPLLYSDNLLVNALAGDLAMRAAEAGVRLDMKLSVPEKIAVEDPDLYCLLANVLENALEACERFAAGERAGERFIELEMRTRSPYLYIRCRNAATDVSRGPDGAFASTKADAANHGYGLQNVAAIVARYDGAMEISCDAHCFTISLFLKAL